MNSYYNGPAGTISPFTRAKAQDVAGQLQAIATAFDRLPDPSAILAGVPGPSAVLGSTMGIVRRDGDGIADLSRAGGLWAEKAYTFHSVEVSFNASNAPVTVAGSSPTFGFTSFVQADGALGDVVGSGSIVRADADNSSVFGGNDIVYGRPGLANVKFVGREIDIQPASGTAPAAGSGGLYVNIFNVPLPGPAFQSGGIGGGSFSNGIILSGIAPSGTGFALDSNAGAISSLVNASSGTYTDAAFIMGNGGTQRLKFQSVSNASEAAGIYMDTDNNFRIKLGSGSIGLLFRDKTDVNTIAGVCSDGIMTGQRTPSSPNDTGLKGTMVYDAGFIYVCIATNQWRRSALSVW